MYPNKISKGTYLVLLWGVLYSMIHNFISDLTFSWGFSRVKHLTWSRNVECKRLTGEFEVVL